MAKFPDQVVPIALDVTQLDQIQKVAGDTKDLQVLVNNAGACGHTRCLFNYDEQMARIEMEVNYFAAIHLIHAFSTHILRNGSGAILNIISIGGYIFLPST